MASEVRHLSLESAKIIDVMTEAAWEAFRGDANGPEVAFWVLRALEESGFMVVPIQGHEET